VPERSTTSRGFSVYGALTDINGSRVRVQQSSSATQDAVWIFAEHPEGYEIPARFRDRLAASGFTRPVDLAELAAMLEPSPHLDVFIREHEG